MKNLIIFVVVVAGAYFAWNNIPGLRTQVTQAANKYGGWSEEDRKNDPEGYIKHAITQLEGDITDFEGAKKGLLETKKSSEAMVEKHRDDLAKAKMVADTIKEQYKSAEETDGWPITFAGDSYDKSQAITTVNNLLREQKESGSLLSKYEIVVADIDKKLGEVSERIADSKFNVESLTAQLELVKVDKLTSDADALLAKVNDLVEGNSRLAEESGPAQTFDEIAKNLEKQAKAAKAEAEEAAANSAALDFLNS